MGVTRNVRTALRAHLDTIPSAPPANRRAWENEDFDPSADIDMFWIRETLAPFNSSLESLPAAGGLIEHDDIWFLDLLVPARVGTDAGDDIADEIVVGYHPGQYLQSGGQAVEIRNAKRDQGIEDAPWFMIPISITVRANTRNPEAF